MNAMQLETQDNGAAEEPMLLISPASYGAALKLCAELQADRDALLSLLKTAKASRFNFMANDTLQRSITTALAVTRTSIDLADILQAVQDTEEYEAAPVVTVDTDWRMNPCKLGHRDVGASGGVAACNICDEAIRRETTQQAFVEWNATHPPLATAQQA